VVTATETTAAALDDSTDGAGWPLQPLLDACRLTPTAMGRHLGVGGATISRAAHGGLSDHQADEWAIRLGFHPLMVWGWAWIDPTAQARGRPSYARVAASVRQAIASGELAPGDPVPSVKALAARWGVATGSVTQALDELRAEGLITGGGRGRRNLIASPLELGPAGCAVCGRPIAAGEEHYPHHPACPMAMRGWCDCDDAAHPECCPACAGGGS
jgi:Bacterial regulatory proteins, gntR family